MKDFQPITITGIAQETHKRLDSVVQDLTRQFPYEARITLQLSSTPSVRWFDIFTTYWSFAILDSVRDELKLKTSVAVTHDNITALLEERKFEQEQIEAAKRRIFDPRSAHRPMVKDDLLYFHIDGVTHNFGSLKNYMRLLVQVINKTNEQYPLDQKVREEKAKREREQAQRYERRRQIDQWLAVVEDSLNNTQEMTA